MAVEKKYRQLTLMICVAISAIAAQATAQQPTPANQTTPVDQGVLKSVLTVQFRFRPSISINLR